MKKFIKHFDMQLLNLGFGILIIIGTKPQLILDPLTQLL